jgi:hypothetical protein
MARASDLRCRQNPKMKGDLPIKADEVVQQDLRYICQNPVDVFSAMS